MAKKMYEETRIAAIAEKIREHTKTETKYTTAEMPSGIDEVYTAGVEAGKSQGGTGGFSLNGTYILKEHPEFLEYYVDEEFLEEAVYGYFYDISINDYKYIPITRVHYGDSFYDWFSNTNLYNTYYFDDENAKWATVNETDYSQTAHPDIKGRIIVFTKPTVVSENFYNLFMATTETDVDIFDEGKQAEYDRFWDSFQANGGRTDYQLAFRGYYWNADTLRPKYTCKVVGNGGASMFERCFFDETDKNNSLLLDISHISIDVTEATDCSAMFQNANVKSVTLIFGDKITSLNNAFTKGGGAGKAMDSITLLVPNPNCDWTNAFAYHNVKELNLLEGTVIGRNGFNVQWATGLSKANITSIINALSDSTSGLSITLSKTAVDVAFAESILPKAAGGSITPGSESIVWQTLIGTKTNWTINLV